MKIRGTDYFFYNVSDLPRAVAFYRDILGLKPTDEQKSWVEFETGNMTLAVGLFGASTDPKIVKNGAAAALSVDDMDAALAELKAKGVNVVMGPEDFPPCTMVIIEDPDRNQIILHKRKDGSVG